MGEPSTNELLSFGDALFLYLEREGIPLNVASVAVFDGPIDKQDLIRYLESKHPHIPRFRQRVVSPPFNVGLPSWQNDPTFDVRNHVHEITLKHGTETELKTVASRVLSQTLDRHRPLWHFTLVHGIKENRCAVVLRIHHALADGISGVGILHELLDFSPAMPKLPRRKAPLPQAPPQSDPISLMAEGIVSTCMYATQRAIEAQSQIMAMAEQIAAMLGKLAEANGDGDRANGTDSIMNAALPALGEIGQLLPELVSATNRLPFNRTICQGPQHFRWAELPLADIKAVKNACGATVNDVILATVTATIRRYAELHHATTAGKLVRIVVPVNVRGSGNVADLGNEITFVPASIPLDITAGRELVQAVHDRMAMLKVARVGELVGIAATIFGAIPTPVQAFLGPIASQLPISACNTICTNVPGPQQPMYLLGRKLVKIYPYVPIGGEMGMNCAILTYDGTAYFGFTADQGAMPDAAVLEKLTIESFADIKKSVGVRSQRKPTVTRPDAAAKAVRKARAVRTRPVRKSTAQQERTEPPVITEQVATEEVVAESLTSNTPERTSSAPQEAVQREEALAANAFTARA